MDGQLLSKVITIIGVETKQTQNGKIMLKVKDHENKSYQVWQTKQDGNQTVAYQGLMALPNQGLNQSVEISYKEQPGDYNGKSVTYRSIVALRPSSVPASVNINNQVGAKITAKDEEAKWKEISTGKVRHAFALEAYRAGKELTPILAVEIAQWTEYVMSGKLGQNAPTGLISTGLISPNLPPVTPPSPEEDYVQHETSPDFPF